MVGTGQVRFGGDKEEVGSRIIQRGGDRPGGGNSPRNDDDTGMRVGVQSSNLTQ